MKVVVYIWSPGRLKETGHVALETFGSGAGGGGIYASFYPSGGGYLASRGEDFAEDHPRPDHIITFNTLDTDAINRAYEVFSGSRSRRWHLLGCVASFVNSTECQNCSGLTLALLNAGGIERIGSVRSLLRLAARDGGLVGAMGSAVAVPSGVTFLLGTAYRAAMFLNPTTVSMGRKVSAGLAAMHGSMGMSGAATSAPTIFSSLFGVSAFGRAVALVKALISPVGLAALGIVTILGTGAVVISSINTGRAYVIPSPSDLVHFLRMAAKKEAEALAAPGMEAKEEAAAAAFGPGF